MFGQVLIKVEAAPLNPSDLYKFKGIYDEYDVFKFNFPQPSGWEGSGTVIKSGGGEVANLAIGKRVSFIRPLTLPNYFEVGGSYQQYAIADAQHINHVDDSIPLDIASMAMIDPITAVGLVEAIK